jgi:hypothetical protein
LDTLDVLGADRVRQLAELVGGEGVATPVATTPGPEGKEDESNEDEPTAHF